MLWINITSVKLLGLVLSLFACCVNCALHIFAFALSEVANIPSSRVYFMCVCSFRTETEINVFVSIVKVLTWTHISLKIRRFPIATRLHSNNMHYQVCNAERLQLIIELVSLELYNFSTRRSQTLWSGKIVPMENQMLPNFSFCTKQVRANKPIQWEKTHFI